MNPSLLTSIPEIDDADEESFLLFSNSIPPNNLGFIDSRAQTLDITIHGQDYAIHQSPSVLSSSRAGGTTGAVLWKITPLFAEWISNPSNPLYTHNLLSNSSTVVELGCGISALTALSLAPRVGHYIATDQSYVQKLFRQNLDTNIHTLSGSGGKSHKKGKGQKQQQKKSEGNVNVTFAELDWETDVPDTLKDAIPTTSSSPSRDDGDGGEEEDKGFDLLLSCDCIYNEALVPPFVRTCHELARLRPSYSPSPSSSSSSQSKLPPTILIIAQQQRTPDVFETWLRESMKYFRVWRLEDQVLPMGLREGNGYLVHLLLLK